MNIKKIFIFLSREVADVKEEYKLAHNNNQPKTKPRYRKELTPLRPSSPINTGMLPTCIQDKGAQMRSIIGSKSVFLFFPFEMSGC
ncbi:hypothetical protein D3C76_1623530 [compost metagenome]